MVTQFVIIISFLHHLFKKNILLSMVIFYEIVSIILNIYGIIDVSIPCIFKLMFNKSCLGCGLTKSFEYLISFNFIKSIETNILVIPISIGSFYHLYREYYRFSFEK